MKKTLKFLSWMFILLFTVSLSSCKDDDEGHPFAGTVWEYSRTGNYYVDGQQLVNSTKTYRIEFDSETKATYSEEYRDNSGRLVENFPSPYTYTFSGSLVIFTPEKISSAPLEGTIVEGVKMILVNTTRPEGDKEIATLYKR